MKLILITKALIYVLGMITEHMLEEAAGRTKFLTSFITVQKERCLVSRVSYWAIITFKGISFVQQKKGESRFLTAKASNDFEFGHRRVSELGAGVSPYTHRLLTRCPNRMM